MDAVTARPQTNGFLPPEAPLAMPVQSLDDTGPHPQRTGTAPSVAGRRAFVFGVALIMSAIAAYEMYLVLAVGGLTTLEAVILVLFVILFAWVALSFASE